MQQGKPPHSLDYASPVAGNSPQSAGLRAFTFTVIIVAIVDITMLKTLGTTSIIAAVLWWVVNFPSIPFVFIIAMLAGASPGEPGPTPLDQAVEVVSVASSCLIWGLIVAGIARWTASRPAA